jgi:serine/threonine-protein kinase
MIAWDASLRSGLADRYQIQDEIGQGGTAVVYRARDLRHHREVAIKILRPGLVGSDGAERFQREIRLVAGLVHPHILPLYDSGSIPSDPPLLFFVMPFIVGESLRVTLRREGRLPLDRALRIAREVAGALDYAHRQQVVHRDVKPENVLLHDGGALITDFGIARLLSVESAGSGTHQVTAPGLTLGTPAYMSPEQAAGDAIVDGRADQYSLGCVLFEMLAGEPPFVGSTRSLLARHLIETPAPVSARRPDVPPATVEALRRALAKEPGQRYPTTAAFAEALATPLAGLGPELLSSSAAAALPGIAVLPFANASDDPANEYLSDGIADELIVALGQVPGLRVASRSSTFALKGNRHDTRTAGALLGVGSIIEGVVRRQGDSVRITAQLSSTFDGRLLWSGRYDRQSNDLLGVQDEIARTIVQTLRGGPLAAAGEFTPRRYTENTTAYALYLRGRYAWNKRTAEGIEEAIELFRAAIAADPSYALAYSGLADTYALGVDYRSLPVGEGMALARAEANKALALDDTLAEAHTSLGWVTFIHDWDWAKAGYHFDRAVTLNPRYATARQWRSWYLTAMGRVREGIAEARVGVELDPASPSIRRSLGWLHHFARDAAAGIEDLRRAIVMNPVSSETHLLLGQSLTWAGQFGEADLALREAINLDPEDTAALAAMGRLRVLQGRLADGREIRDRMLSLAKHRYVSPSDLAKIHLALNEPDAVFAMLERAYAERRGFLTYLKVEPLLDPVRSDPRFQDLVARMGLG